MITDKNSLAKYWVGVQSAINARLLTVKEYLRHPASGFNAEVYFRDLIREYLPTRYTVDTGFVVNDSGERSDFIDILIADTHHIPPLCSEPHFKVYAAESVVAAIELTSASKSMVKRHGEKRKISKLEDDITKIAKVRRISKIRRYKAVELSIDENNTPQPKYSDFNITLSPRSFMITYGDEWKKSETYEKHLIEALKQSKSKGHEVWVNAVFSMSHGMFHFVPNTEFLYSRIKSDALLQFLLFINQAISSYQTYQIDISRYRPDILKE